MLEEILAIHRQIYYGNDRYKDKKTTANLSSVLNKELIPSEENTPKVDFASFKTQVKPIEDVPKWGASEEKTNGRNLESISEELEFHSRRYGGGLL